MQMAKTDTSKLVGKFMAPPHHNPSFWCMINRNHSQLPPSPWVRKEMTVPYIQSSDISDYCLRDWYLSCLSWQPDKRGPQVGSQWEQKWEFGLVYIHLPYPSFRFSTEEEDENLQIPPPFWGRKDWSLGPIFQPFSELYQGVTSVSPTLEY